jgi:Tfp pilus assembly protein PilF
MNHRRSNLWTAQAICWLSLSLAICAGCSSVQPSDKTVITAGPNPLSPSYPAAAAAAQPNPGLLPKPKDTSVAASVNLSDTRRDRLRDVAGDFERRRDEAQYQAALNRWREDDAAGCRQQLDALLARNPEHHPARLLMAEVALSQSAPALALEQTRQVLAAEQNNPEAHHLMALALDELGEPAAALKHYERAATLAPGVERYVVAYQSALNAAVLPVAVRGEAPTATERAAAQSHVSLNRTAIDSSASVNAASDSQRASTATAEGVRQAVYAPQAGVAETSVPATFTHPADANEPAVERELAEFRAKIARAPGNESLALTAAVYALRHDCPAAAIELASTALPRHSESASLYRVVGAAQCRQGNLRAAQVSLSKALSLDNRDPLAYFLMGTTLARLGDADAAGRNFAEAARLDPRYGQNRN